jgi:hypothetical protein
MKDYPAWTKRKEDFEEELREFSSVAGELARKYAERGWLIDQRGDLFGLIGYHVPSGKPRSGHRVRIQFTRPDPDDLEQVDRSTGEITQKDWPHSSSKPWRVKVNPYERLQAPAKNMFFRDLKAAVEYFVEQADKTGPRQF